MTGIGNPAQAAGTKVKNIVISGTNFWNPGDDFVRDGVIQILKKLLEGYTLNFLFYNFNPAFFPQSKFSGIHNMAAEGDLDKYAPFIDAVVIAGLSAGKEIKDLFTWVIKNNLQDKVYLIGAGYENEYVNQHICQEPEETIFKKAKIIVGRTKKIPEFISNAGLPYYHLNCPSILSVQDVKTLPKNKKIEKIGFSIQMPNGMWIENQSTSDPMHKLASEILYKLHSKYQVEVVAHHKSEYFHFLNLLKGYGIPVVFSSFYQDLFDIYSRYDLVVSTRLHSCLFANGFGIPSFIINDTDRHTHTADGFPHAICVNNMTKFDEEFEKIQSCDLSKVASEIRVFKIQLMQKYVDALARPFGLDNSLCSANLIPSDYKFDSEIKEQKFVRKIVKEGMVVFDIGAHLGKYTKLFSLLVGDKGKVYSFEPTPASFKKLACSLKELNCSNVTLVNKGIYSENHAITINEFPEKFNSWNSIGHPEMDNPDKPGQIVPIINSVEVQAVTLDSFCKEQNVSTIDYLKVDVEGAEIHVLKGASNLLERKAIRFLQFEISKKMLEGMNTEAKRVFDFLKSKGYECYSIEPDGNIGDNMADSESFYENYIAYPAVDIGAQLESLISNDNSTKSRVLYIISRLTKDKWLEGDIKTYKQALNSQASWFDAASFLNWYSENFKPINYLEIGVRRGRSMAQVLAQSRQTKAYGFDLWVPNYGGVDNPGPNFIISELKNLGITNLPKFIPGDSHATVPKFWSDPKNPELFELMFVDGDHSYEGAKKDLDICFAHLADGGTLVFDDIKHPSHPELKGLWEEYKVKYSDYIFIEHLHGTGTGIVFKPPFTRLERFIDKNKLTSSEDNKIKVVERSKSSLPIHFFTIVLNGEPFIRYHIDVFKQLPFEWHWHIIEGVADLKHDTAWSVKSGGRISDELHRNGASNDGTYEYLDQLAKEYPENVTIYRKKDGQFWDGKLEMVNAPLEVIKNECLLWQIDADELWTIDQIKKVREMFAAEPDRTAAYYLDYFFVGENLVTTTLDTYGNHTNYEWLRTWRFKPGFRWTAHEPPRLCMPAGGKWLDIASINPFKHPQTIEKGLIFQHYAYATEKQLAFKEIYYGYSKAIAQWQRLQQQKDFPVLLRDYFGWVKDAAQVNTIKSQNIKPLAWKETTGQWYFGQKNAAVSDCTNVLIVRPDSIGDFIIFSAILPRFRTLHPQAKISIVLQDTVAQLAKECPYVDEIITFKESRIREAQYRTEILKQLQDRCFDIAYYPVYSRSEIGDLLTLCSSAKKKVTFNGDCLNILPDIKSRNDKYYDLLIPGAAGVMIETHRNMEFMKALGINVPDYEGTCIWANEEDENHINHLLKSLKINNPVAISPFAKFEIKDWPINKWSQLLSHYPDEQIVICGGPENFERAQKLIELSSHRNIYNLCGKTTLTQTAVLLSRCKFFIGVDTGPAHMAVAVNIPNVVLMGGGHFGRFMPYSPSTTMVHCKMNCVNCNWRCRFGSKPAPCLTQISVETVTKAIGFIKSNSVSERKTPVVITESPKSDPCYKIEEPQIVNPSEKDYKYLVSAIVSTYNSEKYIRGCLEDLENQTIADKIEIVVVDSGSQQNEAAIVKEFQQQYNNIKYIRTERETIYGAWNRGIKASSGKYITNANTDDRHYKDCLEKLAAALEQNPDKVIAYGKQHVTSTFDGEIVGQLGGELDHMRLLNGFCLESQPMWRRDLHDNAGYFDEQFFCSGDYEFWIRATQNFEMIYVDIFTGKRLKNETVISLANQSLQTLENRIISQSYDFAIQTYESIGMLGISRDPRMSEWPEVKVWKRRVAAKLAGRQWESSDEPVDVKEMRDGQKRGLSVVLIETDDTQWQSLQSLSAQNNQDFELIILSYGDVTKQADLAAFNGRICVAQLNDDIGIAFARNVGIKYSNGEYVAFLDSDMQPNPGWVDAIYKQFKNPKTMVTRGQVIGTNDISQNVEIGSYPTICKTANNCVFRKSVLLKMNGFYENLFALEGLELSFRICKLTNDLIDIIRFEPGMLVRFEDNSTEQQRIIQKIRNEHMFIVIWRREPDILGYVEFYCSQDPATREQYESDYLKIVAIAIFLQKGHPEMAMEWAQKAVALYPEKIKGRYILGSYYFEKGQYDKTITMLEPVFVTQLENMGKPDESQLEIERQVINADCCLSAGTMLAKCYMKAGQLDKLKKVYTLLLENQHLTIPTEQRTNIQMLVDKLKNFNLQQITAVSSPSLNSASFSNEADKVKGKYLVSAIVSTYNSEEYFRGCLEDLENQTIADQLEIIIINSGSEQNEESIVKEYQARFDNIVYLKTQREGLYCAWNRAVKAARGQFLTNANTDDRHRKDAFEILANELLNNSDAALVYGDQIITDTPNPSFDSHHRIELAKRPEFSKERLLFGCCVGSQPMWRKSLHDELGYFDEMLTCAGDWDFWLRAAQKYNFKHVPETLGLFYHNEMGIEHGRKIHSLYERYIVGKRYGNPYISVVQQYQSPGNPLVSVVMTAYNAADYIASAIESVLIQNYRNFELVVVDDGSTDNTADIVNRFKNEPVKYYYKKNGGVASSRNLGLQNSSGSFIVMLDSDDMLTTDYIASHLHFVEQHPDADMIYCDDMLIDQNDKPIRIIKRPEYVDNKQFISDIFRCGFPVVHFKTFIKRAVFDKIGLYDEELIVGEDYEMIRRFAKENLKMVHLPAALYLRRVMNGSLSRSFTADKAKSHFTVIDRISKTFTAEQLFPEIKWSTLEPNEKSILEKCKKALAYVGIGEEYIKSNAPDYSAAAFDLACSQLEECCKIEPGNQQVRSLREKCLSIREKHRSSRNSGIYQTV